MQPVVFLPGGDRRPGILQRGRGQRRADVERKTAVTQWIKYAGSRPLQTGILQCGRQLVFCGGKQDHLLTLARAVSAVNID
ncbi:hypothetical protein D3C75_1264510 [compost metagenome]